MEWHIDFEIFSLIIIVILMVYYFNGKYIPTWQNRIYSAILVASFVFIVINITATVCLIFFDVVNMNITGFFNNVYLVFLPLIPSLVLLYVVAVVRQDFIYHKKIVLLLMTPFFLCVLLALSNPLTGLLFTITKEAGYQAERGYFFTYFVFYLYAVMILVFTVKNYREISKEKITAIVGFLVVTALVVIAQVLFPGYILTGAACACCVLLIHLSMQNQSFSIDELTGANKRQVFLQVLEMRLSRGATGKIITVALKDFKYANEVFGVKTCDRLLKEVVLYLEKLAPSQRVYRMDGDVFCLTNDKGSEEDADLLAEMIQERFKKPWLFQGIDYTLSCNLAVVPYNNQLMTSTNEIISAIDFSIHEGKRSNGEHIIRGEEIFSEKFKKKNHIKKMLQYALDNDGFEVHYQPIYSIKKECFATSEALLRMRDPEFGLVSPDDFIPLTEENGMIVTIGLTVFEKVCQFVASHPYTKAGFETVGVNLSVVQCMQKGLADDLIAIMKRYHLPPEYFKFEITETVAVGSMKILRTTMDKLIENGSQFALDDFGIGYSGVTNMLELPFKNIKIDKSLVSKMNRAANTAMALETIINMVHRLKMRVVAEGVETKEEDKRLRMMDCDFIQGYYYSKPLPEDQFSALVYEAAEKNNAQK